MSSVVRAADKDASCEILLYPDNRSNQSNRCTYLGNGMLRAVHTIGEVPSNLINAWKNGTTPQKVMQAATAIYCVAATAYIIYLQSQNCDCLAEFKRNPSLVEQFLEESWKEKNQEHNGSLQDFALSVDQMLTEKSICEEEFYKSGAHETSQSQTISKQVCYDLMDKVCDFIHASENMLILIPDFLKNIPGKLRENVTKIMGRMDKDLYEIQFEFDCDTN